MWIRFRLAVATRLKANPIAVDTPVMVLIARDPGEKRRVCPQRRCFGACHGNVMALGNLLAPTSNVLGEACCCADTFSDRSVHSAVTYPQGRRNHQSAGTGLDPLPGCIGEETLMHEATRGGCDRPVVHGVVEREVHRG